MNDERERIDPLETPDPAEATAPTNTNADGEAPRDLGREPGDDGGENIGGNADAAPGPDTGADTGATGDPAATRAQREGPVPLGKPRPRSGPIVWGALVLALCVYVAVRAAGGAVDAKSWIIATVLGLGALLLAVGVTVLIRNGRERR